MAQPRPAEPMRKMREMQNGANKRLSSLVADFYGVTNYL